MGGPERKARVISTGCISNLLDGTGFEQLLQRSGYSLTRSLSEADLLILNTCAFSSGKEEEAVGLIKKIRSKTNPHAKIIVGGCLPAINRERLAALPHDLEFRPKDVSPLLDFLNCDGLPEESNASAISYSQFSLLKRSIWQARTVVDHARFLNRSSWMRRLVSPLFIYSNGVCCIRVGMGCHGECSYCAIRFAKGMCSSRSFDDIVADARRAADNGFEKLVLVGDEITAWGDGSTNGATVLDIISAILEDCRVKELYLESFEPSFAANNLEQLVNVLSSGRIPVFCSSLQSGSDRILGLMRRAYTASDFLGSMSTIRARCPHVLLRTEFMVGFPSETDEDFRLSLELARELRADFLRVHGYTDRPGTPASRMGNKVPENVIRSRRRRMLRTHWWNQLR
mgnify:CR=1 FL=1